MYFGRWQNGFRVCVGDFDRDYSDAEIRNPELSEKLEELEEQVKSCAIAFFRPSGDGGRAFLNNHESDVKMVVAPNGTGKTTHAIIDVLLSAIPCDPTWAIFKNHGVRWREWTGRKAVVIATYQTSLHKQTIWPEFQKWCPRNELMSGRRVIKEPNWKGNPVVQLACGTKVAFMTYEQDQQAYESFAADIILWDEQGRENLFDGADERVRRRSGRHVFSLTPHKVDGRPDTGFGSWIHKMVTGQKTKGHNVASYVITVDDVPDYVYPLDRRQAAYRKWILEPQETGDVKTLREGRSRYYGEWHTSSGLVYDEIVPEIHFIDPIKIDSGFTLYRAIDHGTNNPTACLWFAVDEDGQIYAYREYYRRNRTIYENVRAIVDASGNGLDELDVVRDEMTGNELVRFEEKYDSEEYAKTVLDSRSFATVEASSGREIGWVYKAAGLLVQPASGKHAQGRIPMIKELLRIDKTRKHPITGEMGCPRILFFNTLNEFRREWMSYVWEEYRSGGDDRNPKEKPTDKNNHLMCCLEYAGQIPMRFLGSFSDSQSRNKTLTFSKVNNHISSRNRITGY